MICRVILCDWFFYPSKEAGGPTIIFQWGTACTAWGSGCALFRAYCVAMATYGPRPMNKHSHAPWVKRVQQALESNQKRHQKKHLAAVKENCNIIYVWKLKVHFLPQGWLEPLQLTLLSCLVNKDCLQWKSKLYIKLSMDSLKLMSPHIHLHRPGPPSWSTLLSLVYH